MIRGLHGLFYSSAPEEMRDFVRDKLWFFGPSATAERNVAVVPTVAPTSAGLTAIGRF